jgi:hypothetical protein
MVRRAFAVPLESTATIPADSWPRCCNEYSPSCTMPAASPCPRIPNIPHMTPPRLSLPKDDAPAPRLPRATHP